MKSVLIVIPMLIATSSFAKSLKVDAFEMTLFAETERFEIGRVNIDMYCVANVFCYSHLCVGDKEDSINVDLEVESEELENGLTKYTIKNPDNLKVSVPAYIPNKRCEFDLSVGLTDKVYTRYGQKRPGCTSPMTYFYSSIGVDEVSTKNIRRKLEDVNESYISVNFRKDVANDYYHIDQFFTQENGTDVHSTSGVITGRGIDPETRLPYEICD